LLGLRIDRPLRVEVDEHDVCVRARKQRSLAGIEADDPRGVGRREAHEGIESHAPPVEGLVEDERYGLLHHLAAQGRGEDVLPAGLLLLQRVRAVVGHEAVGRPVEYEAPQLFDERAVAEGGGAASVRPQANKVVEVEEQVMGADLHRRRPALVLRLTDELCTHRARDMDDLDPHSHVRGQEQRSMDRLLLDERRSRFVVGHWIAPTFVLHSGQAGL
jgi:hypothetical protein